MKFKALVINKIEKEQVVEIKEVDREFLADEDILVRVDYSTINYKDALAVSGKGKIIRNYPLIPGIDLAGTVEESRSPDFLKGDAVLMNGFGVGESHSGGFGGYAAMKSEWLLKIPAPFDSLKAMQIGTAGYTAALCVMEILKHGVKPGDKPVAVTGATGGVGSFAVRLLADRGYEVTAISGKSSSHEYLKKIGASNIIDRNAFMEPGKPLDSQNWSASVDNLGGPALARLLAETAQYGIVTACGLANTFKLDTTVMPFILRAVRLVGVDSVYAPMELRKEAWKLLSESDLDVLFAEFSAPISLDEIQSACDKMVGGEVLGRITIKH